MDSKKGTQSGAPKDGAGSKTPQSTKAVQKKAWKKPPDENGDWLGDKLRELYSDMLSEPLPDDLVNLIKKLDDKDKAPDDDRD